MSILQFGKPQHREITINIDAGLKSRLEILADQRGVSFDLLVNEAIDRFVDYEEFLTRAAEDL